MNAVTDTLTPAEELARDNPVRIPNESAEYRRARTALLAEYPWSYFGSDDEDVAAPPPDTSRCRTHR